MDLVNIKIIIASRNRENSLKKTISCITKCIIPQQIKVSLIIIENETKSKIEDIIASFETAKNLTITYYFVKEAGKSKALNFVLKNYCRQNDFILFTDDDTIIRNDWIVNYYNAIKENGNKYFYGGGIIIPESVVLTKPFRAPFLIASLKGIDENQDYDGLFIGPNWGAHYESIEKAGFFDENIGPGKKINLGEETYLQEKMIETGIMPFFIKGNAVVHNLQNHRITLFDILSKSYMVGKRRSHCKMETKNYWKYFYKTMKFGIKMVLHFINVEKRFKYQFLFSYHLGVIHHKTVLFITKIFK